MKNKIIIRIISICLFFFFSYNISLAAGCCVFSTKTGFGPKNCEKNVSAERCKKIMAEANLKNGAFEASEPNCDGAGSWSFCNYGSKPATCSKEGQACTLADSTPGTCVKDAKTGKIECVKNSSSENKPNPTEKTTTTASTTFSNPLKFTSLSEVLVAILVNLQSFLAIIAIIIIIVGGIMYMFSAGNESMITKAKTTIGGALIGLSIILAAPSFLKQIKITLGGGATGVNADEIVNKAYTIKDIAVSVLNLLLSTIGILGIIALIVGGVMYVTAYGSEDRIGLAKKIIGSALVGILVAFGSLILVKQIAALLGVV